MVLASPRTDEDYAALWLTWLDMRGFSYDWTVEKNPDPGFILLGFSNNGDFGIYKDAYGHEKTEWWSGRKTYRKTSEAANVARIRRDDYVFLTFNYWGYTNIVNDGVYFRNSYGFLHDSVGLSVDELTWGYTLSSGYVELPFNIICEDASGAESLEFI